MGIFWFEVFYVGYIKCERLNFCLRSLFGVRDFLEMMRGSALKAWVDIYMRDCGGIKVG